MQSRPRVRFAPSPTGYLHVGSARTVLFNWLFARHEGGEFLLRIEDTDAERNRPELIDNILEMHRVAGPRLGRRAGAPERPARRAPGGRRAAPGRRPRLLVRLHGRAGPGPGQGAGRAARLRRLLPRPRARRRRRPGAAVPHARRRHDLLRPTSSAATSRSRTPTRGLRPAARQRRCRCSCCANVVDDADMGITHVIRGEDHVNGTPKYLLLSEALGLDYRPVFAHLPLLVNEGRKKLSKRRDAVSVADYRDRGLPARGDGQLPRPAGMGADRRRRDPSRARDRRAVPARGRRRRHLPSST